MPNWKREPHDVPYVPIPARLRPLPTPDTAIGYTRVSTDEQVLSGLGLEAQRTAIERRAASMGLTIVEWFTDDGVSGKVPPTRRAGLLAAMQAMQRGVAEHLIVAKLDRLGRDAARVLDFDSLAAVEGWGIVMCDFDLDTSTAAGRFMLSNLAAAAEFERNLISERTKAALAVKKAQGVRLGRPTQLPREVVERIVVERAAGAGYQRVADGLNRDQVPTAQGGARWYAGTIRAVERSRLAADVRGDRA